MTNPHSTESIYDAHAGNWARSERVLLSDFTARPRVLDALGCIEGLHVLDVGCGEGFVARQIAAAGAASVFGIDVSTQMVEQARQAANGFSACDLQFVAADAAVFQDFNRPFYDRAIAVFLFNYLRVEEMTQVMKQIKQRLTADGRFVFTVPHPAFAYLRSASPPFYFDSQGVDYFDSVDQTLEGEIWRRDGVAVPVRCVHKTFADYFHSLRSAGFARMPQVLELGVTAEHLALDPKFFGPLKGLPLHVLFVVENT